jgi:hypothetical protein
MIKPLIGAVALTAILAGCDGFEDDFKTACLQEGGQVYEKSHVDYGVTSSGRVTWVPSSIRFCKVNGVITDVE